MGIFTQLWKKQYLLLAFMLLSSVMPTFAADANLITKQVTVNVEEAGTLSSIIGNSNKYRIVNLKLTGELNSEDFYFIRDMAGRATTKSPVKRGYQIIGYDYSIEDTPGNLKYLDIQNTSYKGNGRFVIFGDYNQYSTHYAEDYIYADLEYGEYVFYELPNLREVVLPNWMRIGKSLFLRCSELESVNIPSSSWQVSIGEDAFCGCSKLRTLNIPNGVRSIGEGAFKGCSNLTSLNIPESVTSIGESAFNGCSSLISLNIPESVTNIGESAFARCSSLTSTNIPSKVTKIQDFTFLGCSNLTSLNIPESVTNIGESAFNGCSSLTSTNIPSKVTKIQDFTFQGCSSLTSLNIPESVTSIGESAFNGCSSLISLNIPESVTNIGESAFARCSSLTSTNIPSKVTKIQDFTFLGCSNLTSLNIPESVTNIGESAFNGCSSLTSTNIPDNVTCINNKTYYGCSSLTSLNIPENVTSIGESAFEGCRKLETINIPERVSCIQKNTFYGCNNLRSLEIPANVTSIGEDAFKNCGLRYLYVNSTSVPPKLESVTVGDWFKLVAIVPKGSSGNYALADNWGKLHIRERGDIITEPMTVHVSKAGTLSDLIDNETVLNLTNLVITGELNLDDIYYLRQMASCIYGDKNNGDIAAGILCKVNLKDVKLIDDGKSIEIYGTTTYPKGGIGIAALGEKAVIGNDGKTSQGLFACLYGLDSLTLPADITTIGKYSFYLDEYLSTVEIPSSVTDILDDAFYNCINLKSIYCHMAVPANVSDDTVFKGVDKEYCTLYVPIGSAELYGTAEYWKDFKNIVEYDYDNSTGIDKVTTDSDNQGEAHEAARYSINGQRLTAPTQGINIVKYSDGTTKKVMVP